jgi:hypothetical protein
MARTSDQCPRGTHGYRAGWVYRSIEELNAKHSPQDAGISLERREEKRIAYTVLLHDAGQAMQMCAHTSILPPINAPCAQSLYATRFRFRFASLVHLLSGLCGSQSQRQIE